MSTFKTLLTLISLCFLGNINEGWGIPTSQFSCKPEFLKLQHGDSLELNCGSHCDSYAWWKIPMDSRDDERVPIDFSQAILTKTAVEHDDGGQYICMCLPDTSSRECTYSVSVLPEVTFSANKAAIHFGDSLELRCLVEGAPVNFSAIHNIYGIKLSGQVKNTVNEYTTETHLSMQDVEEGDYVCSVETHYRGTLVDSVKKTLSVQLYNPPSIVYTTEFIMRNEKDFGTRGKLTCAVHMSPDTNSHVSWWANGTQLTSNAKYQMDSLSTDQEDIVKYTLTVNSLQQSDIGIYLCQLNSDYALEDSQSAWIQVDYSNGVSSEQRIKRNVLQMHGSM